jgi:FtsH-binding integral membrane protein
MAWETQNSYSYSPSANAVLAEESTRTFMQRVYWWMTVGLGLTGTTAWFVASSQTALAAVAPHFNLLALLTFGIVIAFSFLSNRVSGPVAAAMFLGYAFLNGLLFSTLFLIYELGSISTAFFITAGMFGGMSAYGAMTKKDLSTWSTFLFMGLIGVVIASIVNIFVQSDMLGFVKSCAAVLVFAGLTAYDTQKLRSFQASAGHASALSLSISGALILYLDFVNLFLNILRLFGRRR